MESSKNRLVHYDLLRILAAFSVVMLHSAAQYWYSLPVESSEWKIANAYDALFRFGVPIFVMISGALFLRKELDVKRLYTNHILRLLIIYWVWSAAYGLFDCRVYEARYITLQIIGLELEGGRYHLWFLPMIVGIYVLLPLLHSWIRHADKKMLEYFLVVFLVLQIGRETLNVLLQSQIVKFAINILDVQELSMACSYIGYFVLGYYITTHGIPKKWQKIIYWSMIPAAVLNIVVSNIFSVHKGVADGSIYDSYGMFTFIIVVGIFLFFTEVVSKLRYSERAQGRIQEISLSTFGVYVVHIMCIELLAEWGIDSMVLPNIIGIPLLAVLVFGISIVLAAIMRRIPLIGKYIC